MENNTITNTVNAKSQKLFNLTVPHRASPLMQRIQAFAIKEKSAKLMDYLGGSAPDEEKIEFLDTLIEIVEKQEWDRLPQAPNGQASAPLMGTPSPTKTLAKPATPPPTPPKKPEAPAPETPKPAVAVEPAVNGNGTKPAGTGSKLAALVAELEAELEAERAKPKAPAITTEDIRNTVRAEIATVFETIAKVLRE